MPTVRTRTLLCFAAALAASCATAVPPRAATAAGEIDALIADMTPAERVGQLLLVPFRGDGVSDDRAIARLVDQGVGGVIVDPRAGNFLNAPDTPRQVALLANALQARAARHAAFVPLWIAVDSDGAAFPLSPLRGGMTDVPSAMALGATWDPALAGRVGEVVGRELRAVGVNLWLGPNLDVVAQPRPGSTGDLGARALGGNPSWVAKLGREIVGGIHRGSDGRVAVAAGSFPGVGGADRSQTAELPIVESSLDDLRRTELVPFVAVVEPRDNRSSVVDALVTTHVRFRGVQRQIDRPLSLDGSGLAYLRGQLPSLDAWREGGGLLFSPGLGLAGVRRYTDPQGAAFNVRRVVREALLAGNDVLNLSGFDVPDDPTRSPAEIEEALAWLTAAYEEDDNVREAVDRALRRVLARKRALYAAATPDGVAVDAEAAPASTGLGGDDAQAVARAALTLFAPPTAGGGRAPVPSPQSGDRLLFVVDARDSRECDGCPPQWVLDPDEVLATCLLTYGPTGSGTRRIVRAEDVGVVTARELRAWLGATGRIAAENNPSLVPPWSAARQDEVARGVGSLPYTPLEQYAGDTGHTDVRADLYAVGATLYHLMTGRPPDTAQDRFLLPNALTRPRRLNPDVPSRVESAILTAMALHPERRPPTAEALRALLVGDAPVLGSVELGTAGLAWRQAIWDNAGLIALVALLVLLTVVATWQATAASAPAAAPTASAGSTATAPIATPTGPAAAAPAGS